MTENREQPPICDDDGPSVIGPRPPMPTQEDYRAAHKAEYVRLFAEFGVPASVAEGWHDEGWEEMRTMTPKEAVAEEVSYWDNDAD